MVILCHSVLAQTSDNIANVQNRLKAEGFYQGNPTGIFDTETATALLRFQKRHGLTLSGKLDAATARELNAAAPKPSPTPEALTGSWRSLPNGEMEFVPDQVAATPPPAVAATPAPATASPPPSPQPVPPAEGPLTAGNRPSSAAATNVARPSPAATANENQFAAYVEAFVKAGLDQPQGSEIKFFADRVDYFGEQNVPREQIQRDLLRYDQKWPHRKFWIDGDIQIQAQNNGNETRLVFPLRYELRNGSRYASGKVLKSLTVLRTARGDMQITAVSEWKAP